MSTTSQPLQDRYDAVVVGGGAAGLSAAVTLSRALRSVLVIDAGQPRNAAARGVHGFLTREGMDPLALLDTGRTEAESYGATIVRAEAEAVLRTSEGFDVVLTDGRSVTGRRILFATGLSDGLPEIPGLREQWGAGVVHCPYCHGYEIRGQRIGVLGTGALSVHQALLFRQWSDDITLFLNDSLTPTDEEWDRLAARAVRVVEGAVTSVDSAGGTLTGVTVAGGHTFDLQALAVGTRMESRSILPGSLGLTTQQHPSGMGHFIEPGPMGATAVPGVYVAGNVSNLGAQVIVAAAEGTMAGAAINANLVEEETAWAVEAHRGPFSAASEADVSARVLGLRRHGLEDGLAGVSTAARATVDEAADKGARRAG
ncbi:NAD(P)/FAD-dependent oxidoreductase [Arthrobacter sp. NamB2]|uniref:NAD(P)/FAD-dependent oxidoreductase n=1 Tax=Arthrobacter sp. NamB2 TaxID=2576035 RepID=UPI0010C98ABC|nr:NAD(P)/FAD-dependent oxidoreductase [Arthrobacter sp. NamB2]TKV29420.1 NAD(P)/FAD-dependent oxidoreductase [Arthrobacter sp. NamB2]